jgi:hypothetical protein
MRSIWLVAALAAAGCGDDAKHGGGVFDMSVPDMTSFDMTTPTACDPTDPMNDGTPCSAKGGCPTGTIGVNFGGTCSCYTKCTVDPECSCNRLCDPVKLDDASAGGACLPGNTPGERCSRDPVTGNPFGEVICGQLTVCVNADAAQMFRYCSYKCVTQSDCPAQTTCQQLTDSMGNPIGNVCAYNSGPNGNKMLGEACTNSDVCQAGQLCAGVCAPQCDGPGAACASGTCTRIDDPTNGKVIGYVCE